MLGANGFPIGLDVAVFLCCIIKHYGAVVMRCKLYFHVVAPLILTLSVTNKYALTRFGTMQDVQCVASVHSVIANHNTTEWVKTNALNSMLGVNSDSSVRSWLLRNKVPRSPANRRLVNIGDVIAILSGNAVLTKAVRNRFDRIKTIQKGRKKDEIRSSTICDSGRKSTTCESKEHGSNGVTHNDGVRKVGIYSSGNFIRRKEVHRHGKLSA